MEVEHEINAEDRVAELTAQLAQREEEVRELQRERDLLRASHEQLRLELELLKRRIYLAKAERVDSTQLELEFAAKLAALEKAAGTADIPEKKKDDETKSKKSKPAGRRDLSEAPLVEDHVLIKDPVFEELVRLGKAEHIKPDRTYKLAWQRGGFRKLVIERAKYHMLDSQGESTLAAAEMPKECFPRSIGSPSLIAHIVDEKYFCGLSLFRLEDDFRRLGVPLDRGTMSRWMEDTGATLGATIVKAMRDRAFRTAFCIATDATGIAVQPVRSPDKHKRRPCDRGHYFVMIPDRQAVFFEYTRRETSDAVSAMFRGYKGFVQADAKSVFDVLFEPDPVTGDEGCEEVGCWVHCRRKFWESACAHSEVGREGLRRIARIFELESTWKSKPHAEIKELRERFLKPHILSFFDWAGENSIRLADQRGLDRTAVGYALRQREALMRILADGRLLLDNNRSERELRQIAVCVSLCTPSSSTWNREREIVARIATRAPCAPAAAA